MYAYEVICMYTCVHTYTHTQTKTHEPNAVNKNRPSPASSTQIVHLFAASRLVEMLFCCCPKRLMFYFGQSLERPLCHINQGTQGIPHSVFCQSGGLCLHRQQFIGRNKLFLSQQLTSWCQFIICALNLMRFPCAKSLSTANQDPHTHRCSQTNTRAGALSCRHLENEMLHPS